jgi:hypothetical protein
MSYKLADGSLSTDYKVGDLFVVAVDDERLLSKGGVVKLSEDDNSDRPWFDIVDGEIKNDDPLGYGFKDHVFQWEHLEPFKHNLSSKDMTQSTYDDMFDRIELLESLLVDANKRIAELEAQPVGCLPKEFKPISQMTLEDWDQAKYEHAVFVTNEGCETIIEDIDNDFIFFDRYAYGFTIDGQHSNEPNKYYVTKRIR